MKNITVDLIEHAKSAPRHPALILGNRSVTYAELDALAWGAAHYLFSKGMREGDRVALVISDQLVLASAVLGAMRMGATVFVLTPSRTRVQRDVLIKEANARFLFANNERLMSAATTSLILDETCLVEKSSSRDLLCSDPEAFCQIIAGSGSTGRPRLMPLTHQNRLARSEILQQLFGIKPEHRFMCVSPLDISTPLDRFLGTISAGATSVLWDQKSRVLSAIQSAHPDFLHLSVFHAELMLQEASTQPGFDLSNLQMVSIGATTISETLRRRLKEDLKAKLHINYGTNEAGTGAFAYPNDLTAAKGGVGRAPKGVTLEIVDPSGQKVSAGTVGLIRVKSPGKIDGYLDGSDADRFQDGFFYPGDLGKWTSDGQLIHHGRADQMMICSGVNIYPAESERALEEHPAVAEVAVFPMKHSVQGDIPVCAVSLKAGAQVSEADLRTFARDQVGFSAPRDYLIVKELPRNQQGKLIRSELYRLMSDYLNEKQQVTLVSSEAGKARVSRQNMRVRRLRFLAPQNLSVDPLAAWRPYFNDATLPCDTRKSEREFPPQTAPVAQWFAHVLTLTRDLLLAVNIPCFEDIQLLQCLPASDPQGAYRAAVLLPDFENYPLGTFDAALHAAMTSTSYMQENPPTDTNRDFHFRMIEENAFRDIGKGNVYASSTIRVLHAGYRMGIPFWHLGLGVYQLGWGAASKLVDRSTSANDTPMSSKLTMSKNITASVLRDAGLPAPTHRLVTQLDQAREAAERVGWPVVIKPSDLERGEGVHVDVQREQLETAFENAINASPKKEVLVERQVKGVCHRLFVAGGQLLYAVKRLPIGVYGDGDRSIAEIVDAEYAAQLLVPPWKRSKIKPLDDLGRTAIASLGLSPASVPNIGQFVALRRIETTAWGGVDEDVTDNIHPENLRVALAAASLCGLDVAGVDIITDDISKPWPETGAIINEVNYAPSLGGGDISRSHLPDYMKRLMGGNGRIRTEVFVGDERAFDAAKARMGALRENDKATYLTTDTQTFDPSGQELPLAGDGLRARVRALVLNRDVETLIIVGLDDSLLDGQLPLEGVDAVQMVGEPTWSDSTEAPEKRRQRLSQLLSDWIWPQ